MIGVGGRGLKQTRRECLGKEWWTLFFVATLLGDVPGWSKVSNTLDG